MSAQHRTQNEPAPAHPRSSDLRYLIVLGLGALGIVYGDIGTSPLYALRECFKGPHALLPTAPNVLGILSLIIWSLIIIISIKYLVFVMRADNRGEGGILALVSLIRPRDEASRLRLALVIMGLFGAALLYGDGMITPAISVLSAVEGLSIATPIFDSLILPLTVIILIGLFALQQRGTSGVGTIFGPVMLVWFVCIAVLGVHEIIREPEVVLAVNPVYGFAFFRDNGWAGFLTLGTVFLAVTGGEALYADMGHFGVRPIRNTWFVMVLPSLVLNYLGQGALLLRDPSAAEHPLFHMVPGWALYPMVGLATLATVIASQAVISGAFSLSRQAVQLGYSPRLEIRHTSAREMGQIYVPGINWVLMLATIGLVLGFHSSSNLAAAYGVAVTATMAITTILLAVVARERWGWSLVKTVLIMGVFLIVDLAFLAANLVKIPHGGWFPLVVAAVVLILMTTWNRGRKVLTAKMALEALSVDLLLADLAAHPPVRVAGTAIFMSRTVEGVPTALLHNLKHNKVLHDRVILMTVTSEDRPHIAPEKRVTIEDLGHGMFRMLVRYGFMEDPDIPQVLRGLDTPLFVIKPDETTFFLGKETLLATKIPGMALWREHLFAVMNRNARSATSFFHLPPNRVVELGAQVEI